MAEPLRFYVVDDIAQKYIAPPETLDFAFMFVPAESVFQLLLQQRALHEKLLSINVIPASPNSFYAYLQALAFALLITRPAAD